MSSFTTLAVLYLLAFFLVYQRFRIARSNAVEPLKVRIVTPKVDAVAPVMVEPLRAPVQSFDISVGAQKLSINDPTPDVDDLISSFASFSLKARLPRSCCKSRSSLFSSTFHSRSANSNRRLVEMPSLRLVKDPATMVQYTPSVYE
jgi:hypothetical protein